MSDRAYLQADHLWFFCPGCRCAHRCRVAGKADGGGGPWEWNGRTDLPTLSPSVLCWSGEQDGKRQRVCHSYVRDGAIQFLGDCHHPLAGQTVDLPSWKEVLEP